MKGKVIILNGPPGSGKDTIADYLEGLYDYKFVKCENKSALHEQAIALSQVSKHEWFSRYENRELKETPWDRLGGLTQREFLIKISEEFVKPIFGKDFYGRVSCNTIKTIIASGGSPVFSDGGFVEEFNAMKEVVGEDNILLVRLHRKGCDFTNDSRSYLSHPNFEVDIYNDLEIPNAVADILITLSK